MKDMEIIPSEAASVIRACTQTFFDDHEIPLNIVASEHDEEKTTCHDAVNQLPVHVQERLCDNPLALVNEKNPFTLGKTMFNPAIEQMGCDVATALLTQPFTLIQKEACYLTQAASTLNKTLPVIEFIGQRCQVTVSMSTRQKIVDCYPTYNVSATEETIQQDLNETTAQCQQIMQTLPYSEKLKLCDTIDSALIEEMPREKILQLIALSKTNSQVSLPTTTQTPEEEERQQKKTSISVDKIFIGERIVERSACEDLQRAQFPLEKNKPLFIQIERVCFTPYSFPLGAKRPQIAVDDSYFEQCQSFVQSLPTTDKQYLCEADLKTTFAQHYYASFFMRTRRNIRAGCQGTTPSAEENLAATLQQIAEANSRRGIIGEDQVNKSSRIRRNPILSSFEIEGDNSTKQVSEQYFLALNHSANEAPTHSGAHTATPSTLTVIGSVGLLAAAAGVVAGVATYFFKSSSERAKNHAQNDPLLTQETSSAPDVYIPTI